MSKNRCFFICCLILITVIRTQGQSTLNIRKIMQGNNFTGHFPEEINWSEDSKHIYFKWNPGMAYQSSLYKAGVRDLSPEKVTIEEQKQLPAFTGDYSHDFKTRVYEKNGDIFLMNTGSGEIRRITNTLANERNPAFTADEKAIVFRKGNNLFLWSIDNGSYRQLTNFTGQKSENEKELSKREEWLKKQQLELFGVLREKKDKREAERSSSEALSPDRPKEIYLDGKELSRLSMSPDRKFVLFTLREQLSGNYNTKVPDYITEDGYIDNIRAREKVGSPKPTYEFGIYDIENDSVYYVSTGQIPGIYDKPAFLKDYIHPDSTYDVRYGTARNVSYPGLFFNERGDRAILVIRSHDNKDRWIMHLNMSDGSLELIDRQRDEAWIGGPGISLWNYEPGNCGWVDEETFWFQSEASGHSHIYAVHVPSGEKKQLTSGKWEVYEAGLSRDKAYFYITANKENPFERHFYRMPVRGGGRLSKYTEHPGNYEVTVSPDEKLLAIRYSYANKPWELYLMPNRPGAGMQQVTYSTTEDFNAYEWRDPEIIRFTAGDGTMVPARLYRPDNPENQGPAVIFVHGAGYLQNVHRWWSQYFREYMFHNFLADHGYTVLDIDYRGSEGYGRDWRTAIYRHMGGKDLSDQVDGAKYLVDTYSIDPGRIGIYGGSYGGFITLFALFKNPGVFKCGAALRSVTDWAHYNHEYTSNILNTPVEDSLAYRRSSPIYDAAGLQDELLMLHGMVDDNVQFQDVVRLSQRLIELGKDNWDLAVFPVEKHAFEESSSWADEYRRIFELFERNLK